MNAFTFLRKAGQLLLASIIFFITACQTPLSAPGPTAGSNTSGNAGSSTTLGKTPTPKRLVQDREWEITVDKNLALYVERAPLAGATIAIRMGDDRLFIRAYGLEDLSPSSPTKVDTIYEIGSVTMQFTAAAILRLAEQHRLSLDDPITAYLASLPPSLSGIQIRHLLNHTSGIFEPQAYYSLIEDTKVYTPQEILDKAVVELEPLEKATAELKTGVEPGTAWSYSYFGYFLLGMIIEATSGQSYPDYLAENIFKPAGLQSTGYCPDIKGPRAKGYWYENREFTNVNLNMSVAYSSGGLCSTAKDLLAWQRALERGEVINGVSYLEMITPLSPEKVKDNYVPYGYGEFIGKDQEQKIIFHGGYWYGTETFLLYYPEQDLTIVMFTNSGAKGTSIFDFVRSNIVPLLFESQLP